MKSILLVKRLLGLVEMMSGLVNTSFSLPEWQAVEMIFFTPCKFLVWQSHFTLSYTSFVLASEYILLRLLLLSVFEFEFAVDFEWIFL